MNDKNDETSDGSETPADKARGVWFGMSSIVMMGWMIVIPPLVGAFVGHWIDSKWPSPISWTMILILVGLVAGCYSVWAWAERHLETTKRDKGKPEDK